MSILQLPTQVPAQVGIFPNLKFMVTTDNIATLTTAGYLNGVSLQSNPISSTDLLMVIYSFNQQTSAGTFGIFTVSVSTTGVITLATWANPGDVVLPTVVGDFAQFNTVNGQLIDNGISPSDGTKDKVVMADAATTLNNWAMFTDTAGTVGNILKADGTEAANAVTASGKAGVITTSALTTAAGSSYAITWTNTQIAATSAIQLTLMGGTNTIKNITLQATSGVGTSTLTIYNTDAAAPLDGTLLIGYQVV